MSDNEPRDPGPKDDSPQAAHRAFHRVANEYGGIHELGPDNPAKSAKQQRFMGADLARARKGEKTRTGMGAAKLHEMAQKPKGGY